MSSLKNALRERLEPCLQGKPTAERYGRVLLRYSGTEQIIRLLIEGRDVEYLEAQADKIASAILAQIG